jgi:site-specific recombinase XerD
MKEYSSRLGGLFGMFVKARMASHMWSDAYARNLRYFDRYCAEQYPDAIELTQEIVDGWKAKRSTETPASRDKRIYVVLDLVKYCNDHNLTDLEVPMTSKWEGRVYTPHAFTKKEFQAFFKKCDALDTYYDSRKAVRIRNLTIPVFFRLLYSSGIRTTEARLLKYCDVKLDTGVLNIVNTKGRNQHYVVMHDSMLDLMRKYDTAIKRYLPQRDYFFSNNHNNHFSTAWVDYNFRQIWYSITSEEATAYDIRHNYAIQNINNWIGSTDFNFKFQCLSHSMGHYDLESTKYYYSLVPAFADVLQETSEDSFNEIVPEVIDYE